MADLEITFEDVPITGAGRILFREGTLESGEDTIIIDLGIKRLAAILTPTSTDVTTFTIKPYCPWASGEAAVELAGVTITTVAGKLVAIPYTDSYWWNKVALVGNTTETADRLYCFFAFQGAGPG